LKTLAGKQETNRGWVMGDCFFSPHSTVTRPTWNKKLPTTTNRKTEIKKILPRCGQMDSHIK